MGTSNWQPAWYSKDTHGSAWERAKVAMKRDWEQTKNDFGVAGTKDLGQDAGDTVKQAAGKEAIPAGSWDDAEAPLQYGYAARDQFGKEHGHAWNEKLEGSLKDEWEKGRDATRKGWSDVKQFVRKGYESARN